MAARGIWVRLMWNAAVSNTQTRPAEGQGQRRARASAMGRMCLFSPWQSQALLGTVVLRHRPRRHCQKGHLSRELDQDTRHILGIVRYGGKPAICPLTELRYEITTQQFG